MPKFAKGQCPPDKTTIDRVIKQLDAIDKDIDKLVALVAGKGEATKKKTAKAREILSTI